MAALLNERLGFKTVDQNDDFKKNKKTAFQVTFWDFSIHKGTVWLTGMETRCVLTVKFSVTISSTGGKTVSSLDN